MAATKPNTNLCGIISSANALINAAFDRGVKHGRYLEQQERILDRRWVSTADRLPSNTDGKVLVIVSGKPRKNITLIDAYEFAEYVDGEGWILEAYPLYTDAKVTYWTHLPKPPKEVDYENA